jgi:hypothetical protein
MRHIVGRNPFKAAMATVAAGWVAFVASLFLPATNVVERGGTPPGTPLVGWDAAVSAVTVPLSSPLVFLAEPLVLLLIPLAAVNVVLLASPLVVAGVPDRAPWLAAVLLPAGVVAVFLPSSLKGQVFVGFYMWVGSCIVVAAGCVAAGLSAPGRGPGDA